MTEQDLRIALLASKRPWWRRDGHRDIFVISVLYLIFGGSMLLQPERWTLTPAHHNILQVAPEQTWGVAIVAVSCLMLVSVFGFPRFKTLGQVAVSLTCGLTGAWLIAFVLRWMTSNNTTPETWGSFAVILYVLVRALWSLDAEYDPR